MTRQARAIGCGPSDKPSGEAKAATALHPLRTCGALSLKSAATQAKRKAKRGGHQCPPGGRERPHSKRKGAR